MDQRTALQGLVNQLIKTAGEARAIRYLNLAAVSQPLAIHIRSLHYPTVAILHIRLDSQPGSRGENVTTS